MEDDDEYSSGSGIDPSHLLGDHGDQSETESVQNNIPPYEGEESQPPLRAQHADATTAESSAEDSGKETSVGTDERMKIVLGESVLRWKRERQKQSSSSVVEKKQQNLSEWLTIRQDATLILPLNGAEITLKPPTVEITSGDKAYTGKYSSLQSSNPWVDCAAVYDVTRKCHVLQVVDTISNIESLERESLIPTSHRANSSRTKSPKEKRRPKDRSTKEKPSTERKSTKEKLPQVKYRGVTAVRRKNDIGYRSQITLDGKPIYLGTFLTPEDAARRYDEEARKKAKRARLNFPDESSNDKEDAEKS